MRSTQHNLTLTWQLIYLFSLLRILLGLMLTALITRLKTPLQGCLTDSSFGWMCESIFLIALTAFADKWKCVLLFVCRMLPYRTIRRRRWVRSRAMLCFVKDRLWAATSPTHRDSLPWISKVTSPSITCFLEMLKHSCLYFKLFFLPSFSNRKSSYSATGRKFVRRRKGHVCCHVVNLSLLIFTVCVYSLWQTKNVLNLSGMEASWCTKKVPLQRTPSLKTWKSWMWVVINTVEDDVSQLPQLIHRMHKWRLQLNRDLQRAELLTLTNLFV